MNDPLFSETFSDSQDEKRIEESNPTQSVSEGEPKRREDNGGKYRLRTANVITNGSFDSEEDAENWGRWNNFGRENPYEIILNSDLTNSKDDWEKEFDDAFNWIEEETERCKIMYGFTSDKLKDFIRQTITTTRKAALEEALQAVPERCAEESTVHTRDIITMSTTELWLEKNRAYNQCRTDVLAEISLLIEGKV